MNESLFAMEEATFIIIRSLHWLKINERIEYKLL